MPGWRRIRRRRWTGAPRRCPGTCWRPATRCGPPSPAPRGGVRGGRAPATRRPRGRLADKALTGWAVVTLSVMGELWWLTTAVILFRELAVTGMRFWVIRRGVIPASRGGKAKTLLQVIAIGLYILPGPSSIVRGIVMAAAVAVTIVTGVDYAVRAMRLRRAVPPGTGAGE